MHDSPRLSGTFKGGVGSNEFRVENKAGEEQIFVQAQRDFDALTKHNHTHGTGE